MYSLCSYHMTLVNSCKVMFLLSFVMLIILYTLFLICDEKGVFEET